jgi:Regulator of ribonuclease activity B
MDDSMTLLVLAVLLASLAIILLRLRRRKEPGTAFANLVVNQSKSEPPRIETHKAPSKRPRVDRKQSDLPKIAQPIINRPRMVNPAIEQPVMPQPAINPPVMSQPAINPPVMSQPAINPPVMSQPVINSPVMPQPAMSQPAMAQPAINQPMMTQPIIEQPVVANPNFSQQYVTQSKQELQKGEPPKVNTPKTEPQKTDLSIKIPEVDQRVLDQLREAGSDLSKPHDLEFFLYFPNQEAAAIAAERIRTSGAGGFMADVKRSPQGDAWLCYVTRKMVPEGAKIALIGERFSALAQEFGGEYDGWETSLVK